MKKATMAVATAPATVAAVPPASAEDRRCGTCVHCWDEFMDEDGERKGACYRYPPVVLFRPYAGSGAAPMSVRPTVCGDDAGCGEWEK